jgi:hypothetical protein
MARAKKGPLKFFARIGCWLGKHDRSRSQAVRYADNTVLSTCRHCGTSMFRHPREGWMVERRVQQRCVERAGKPGRGGDEATEPTTD